MTRVLPDQKLLKSKRAVFEKSWQLWEKKNFNLHRGLIEWVVDRGCNSVDAIAARVREGVKAEFKPGWLRGFGFGTILHLQVAPHDFIDLCRHIDTRNKAKGVWQWAILCFDNEKIAVGMHTWLHGYLRPVYETTLKQLEEQGYKCHSVDAEIDPFIKTLQEIGRLGHGIGLIDKIFK